MNHLSNTELHDIAYGLVSEPRHVRECKMCETAIASIRMEKDVLSQILKEPPARLRIHWAWGVAAAAGLLVALVIVLAGPILGPDQPVVVQDGKEREEGEPTLKELVGKFAKGDKSLHDTILKAGSPAMHHLADHREETHVLELIYADPRSP